MRNDACMAKLTRRSALTLLSVATILTVARNAAADFDEQRIVKREVVTSLTMYGSIRFVDIATAALGGEREFELRILLPDNFLRIVTSQATVTRAGIKGPLLLDKIVPLQRSGNFLQAVARNEAATLAKRRAELTVLALGLFGERQRAIPLALRGQTRSAGITSTTLAGRDGFLATVDTENGLDVPVRVHHEEDVRLPHGLRHRVDRTGRQPTVSVGLPQPERALVTWTFEERREIGHLLWPHRVTRSARGVVLEQIAINTLELNRLTLRDFTFKN